MIRTLLCLCLLLTGCMASMPNSIEEQRSNFDNSRRIVMQPGFVYENDKTLSYAYFKLGLSFVDTHPDSLIITVEIPQAVTSIDSDRGLLFNVDGVITALSTSQVFTDFDIDRVQHTTYTASSKRYLVPRSFLGKLLSADSVKVRLHTAAGFLEGDLLVDRPSAAIRGFREFAAKM